MIAPLACLGIATENLPVHHYHKGVSGTTGTDTSPLRNCRPSSCRNQHSGTCCAAYLSVERVLLLKVRSCIYATTGEARNREKKKLEIYLPLHP